MTTIPAQDSPRLGRISSSLDIAEYFAPQPTATADLPDPEPLARNLTRGVLEVLAGVREVEQLARWLSEDAYRALVTRANLSARARSARQVAPARPVYSIASVRLCEPADGVVECSLVVTMPARTRAVAMRLEGRDGRWRAMSLALL
ncbi:MAG: Rv3235 family protein [Microbacterium arborescens]